MGPADYGGRGHVRACLFGSEVVLIPGSLLMGMGVGVGSWYAYDRESDSDSWYTRRDGL
jgi:hypothetical protein